MISLLSGIRTATFSSGVPSRRRRRRAPFQWVALSVVVTGSKSHNATMNVHERWAMVGGRWSVVVDGRMVVVNGRLSRLGTVQGMCQPEF